MTVEDSDAEYIKQRITDYLRSTSEVYLQPVGSELWIRGLVSYIVHGPGKPRIKLQDCPKCGRDEHVVVSRWHSGDGIVALFCLKCIHLFNKDD